jgi:hypothetical protein
MAAMKGFSVSRGSDLTDLIGRVRLALKRDDGGAVQAAQFLHLSDDSGEGFYLVTGCEATRGAVNGSTTLALALCAGHGFPPVALLNSREPAPCNVARATDAEVIAAIAVATGGSAVHLNPPTPRPARATREGLRPVEFDCAPPVAGRCGTRGQRFEPESLETVSILSPSEGSAEWASAVDTEVLSVVTDEPAPSAEVAPVMEAASDEPAPSEPAPVTDEPAPAKGKRSRKG